MDGFLSTGPKKLNSGQKRTSHLVLRLKKEPKHEQANNTSLTIVSLLAGMANPDADKHVRNVTESLVFSRLGLGATHHRRTKKHVAAFLPWST